MTIQTDNLGNEAQYLQRIGALLVLNNSPEVLFAEATKLASKMCKTPIALISLIDHKRQWFKANIGLDDTTNVDRDIAFFSHAILQKDVVEIPNAQLDPRFKNNPLVTQKPNVCFYAGAPIIMPSGKKVGTLSVIDQHANRLEPVQKMMLAGLAQIVAQALVPPQQFSVQVDTSMRQPAVLNQSLSNTTRNNIDDKIKDWKRSIEAVAA